MDRTLHTRHFSALVFCMFGVVGNVFGIPISQTALFLPPALVPIDDYTAGPTFGTTIGRTFRTDANSLTLNFSPGSILDLPSTSTITGARILPLLNPNPSTSEGQYSDADLSNITASNFQSYFFRLPGTDSSADYWADLDNTGVAVSFNATGQYFLQIDYLQSGQSSSTALYHVEVNDFFAGDGAADKAGVSRKIDGPTTDFNIVSTRAPGDNKAADNASTELTNRLGANRVARAGTLQEACDKIKAASEAAKKKLSVSLMGHGRPGSIRIGTERINGDATGTMTALQFQECIDPYVSRIEFWSCSTAEGDVGSQFLRDFASSIGSASGFTVPITVATDYWDIRAGAVRASEEVPEPATVYLLIAGLMAACLYRRTQRQSS